MTRILQIAMTQHLSRLRWLPGCVTVFLSTLALSGCASFSPDGGMTVVANVANETIR
jgi:hypothetical protein